MKTKFILPLVLSGLILLINSCKKETPTVNSGTEDNANKFNGTFEVARFFGTNGGTLKQFGGYSRAYFFNDATAFAAKPSDRRKVDLVQLNGMPLLFDSVLRYYELPPIDGKFPDVSTQNWTIFDSGKEGLNRINNAEALPQGSFIFKKDTLSQTKSYSDDVIVLGPKESGNITIQDYFYRSLTFDLKPGANRLYINSEQLSTLKTGSCSIVCFISKSNVIYSKLKSYNCTNWTSYGRSFILVP